MSLEIHLKNALARIRYQIRQIPEELWDGDREFQATWARARTRTLIDATSAFMLHQLARRAARVEGDAAEVGVYKGGTALVLSRALPDRRLHLFDTFAGMPEHGDGDMHREGDYADAPLETVRAFLGDRPGLEFHEGVFPATAEPVKDARFCLVHVDTDLERSVRDACEFFWPRLSPGGVLLVDDYGMRTCPGVRAAVDSYFAGRTEKPLVLPTGQCVVWR